MHNIKLAWRLLRREWRSGELNILIMALLIAVASVTSIDLFTHRVHLVMHDQSGRFHGGDLLLRSPRAVEPSIVKKAQTPAWDDLQRRYSKVEQELRLRQASPDSVVLVNDAPTYYLASRRPSISIPYGDTQALLEVAQRYGGRYLLLEIEQVQDDLLYQQPGDRPGLHYLGTVEGIRLYEFVLP